MALRLNIWPPIVKNGPSKLHSFIPGLFSTGDQQKFAISQQKPLYSKEQNSFELFFDNRKPRDLFRGFVLIVGVQLQVAPPLPKGLCLSIFSPTDTSRSVSYTHLRAHETRHDLVCRLLL